MVFCGMCHHIGSFMAFLPYLPVVKFSVGFAERQLEHISVISGILQSRMSAAFYLPSSSNYPVNPMISLKSSLNSIYPTTVDPDSLAMMRLWNA